MSGRSTFDRITAAAYIPLGISRDIRGRSAVRTATTGEASAPAAASCALRALY